MYLMYIDESGDTGITYSQTKFFVISAIVIHESKWQDILDDLINFRKQIKSQYGLLLREEIHASEFINGSPKLKNLIHRNDKLEILKKSLKWLDSRNDLSIVTVRCNKVGKTADIFEFTWRILIQRFENTLAYNNFPNAAGGDKGLILADNTNGRKLTHLLRKMRRINHIPHAIQYGSGSRNITLKSVVEDPILRDSANSYLHQMVDVVAYFARQFYEPNKYVKKKGARTFYTNFLTHVTNPHVTTKTSPNNIVEV